MTNLTKQIWDWLNNREDERRFEYDTNWWGEIPDDPDYVSFIDKEIERQINYNGNIGK